MTQTMNAAPDASVLEKVKAKLVTANMSEEATAFILGRLMAQVFDTLTQVVVASVDKETLQKLLQISDEGQRTAQMASIYQQKSGKTIAALYQETADALVKEFESLT